MDGVPIQSIPITLYTSCLEKKLIMTRYRWRKLLSLCQFIRSLQAAAKHYSLVCGFILILRNVKCAHNHYGGLNHNSAHTHTQHTCTHNTHYTHSGCSGMVEGREGDVRALCAWLPKYTWTSMHKLLYGALNIYFSSKCTHMQALSLSLSFLSFPTVKCYY